jgi:catechol 2,3-dioxygenase-like lactoylglutathione lyase family enzyme
MPNNWSVTHHHVAIRVRDIQASIQFYREVLGLELLRAVPDANNPTMVWFPGVQLVQKTEEDKGDEGWRFAHVAFQTVNGEQAAAEMAARGLKFLPHEPGKPWFFYDPDGTLIEFLP